MVQRRVPVRETLGLTPLHHAGSREVAALLLEKGAQMEAKAKVRIFAKDTLFFFFKLHLLDDMFFFSIFRSIILFKFLFNFCFSAF